MNNHITGGMSAYLNRSLKPKEGNKVVLVTVKEATTKGRRNQWTDVHARLG
jgi:hypothetical protein